MRIVVLGAYGEMGRVTVTDLVDTCKKCEIVAVGRDMKKLSELAHSFKHKKFFTRQADITNIQQTAKAIKGCDVVINAAQYYHNLYAMKACLLAKTNYLDLGGLYHVAKKQLKLNNKFKKSRLLAIVGGCGSTPGISNVMAAFGAKQFDSVKDIHIRFGDMDYTKYNMPFVVPYSMHTLFDEFTMKAAMFKNGRTVFVEPFSEVEKVYFPKPVNAVNCYCTLHSEVATFPISFKEKGLRNCTFKGGFDPELVKKIKFLIETGFTGKKPIKIGNKEIVPRDFTVKMLNRFIPGKKIKYRDVEFLKVEISGKRKGRKKKLVVYSKVVTNKKRNISGGMWNTGATPSVVAQMLARGEIQGTGTLTPERCIPQKIFFRELKKRNMTVFTAKK